MLHDFDQILSGSVFVCKPGHDFTSHTGTETHFPWWHRSEIENKFWSETFKCYCPSLLPKQVEYMSQIVQTDFHEAIVTAATWKSVCSFLSEDCKSWQYTGKASSSWRTNPLLYSENHYCFSTYTTLHLKCHVANCCAMKLLDSKQVFPAILNLLKMLLPALVILQVFGTLSFELVSGKYLGQEEIYYGRLQGLKDHY